MANSNRPLEPEISIPRVLIEYLNEEEEESLYWGLLSRLEAVEDDAAEKTLLRRMRKAWFRGRCRYEVIVYRETLRDHDLLDRDIAARIRVSPQAVGQWFNAVKGIESENLELLRRLFSDELATLELPSPHHFDVAGYQLAISLLAREDSSETAPPELSLDDFWTLWFMFRNRSWLEANRNDSADQKRIASREIHQCKMRAMELVGMSEKGSKKPLSVAQLEKLIEYWGGPYLVIINLLDAECWTAPDV